MKLIITSYYYYYCYCYYGLLTLPSSKVNSKQDICIALYNACYTHLKSAQVGTC